MSMSEWAEREIELAMKRERGDKPAGEWDYGCACYESAYKAYKSLMEDGHSGMSISITKHILNRLIDGKVLTPIEDTPDIWNDVSYSHTDGTKTYQCSRQSSLFKDVYSDGRVEYHDINRIVEVNSRSHFTFHNGFINDQVKGLVPPIEMPYIPEDKPYKVYCSDFLYGEPETTGSYNRLAIWHMTTPKGDKIDIHKFFKEFGPCMIEYPYEAWEKDYVDTFGEAGDLRYE